MQRASHLLIQASLGTVPKRAFVSPVGAGFASRAFRFCCLIGLLFAFLTGQVRAGEPPITAVAFDRSGERLVAVSQAGIQVVAWPSLERLALRESQSPNLHCLKFSPDGRQLAVGGGAPAEFGAVEVFEWPGLKLQSSFGGHSDSVRAVGWGKSGQLISASLDRSIRVWEHAESDQPVKVLEGHSRGISALGMANEFDVLVSAGADNSVRMWQQSTWRLQRNLNQHTGPLTDCAFGPATSGLPLLATASEDRTIRFWQPTIGRMVRYIRLDSVPQSISWLAEGGRLLAACRDGVVRLVDYQTLQVVRDFNLDNTWLYCVAIHPDGEAAVVGGRKRQLIPISLSGTP